MTSKPNPPARPVVERDALLSNTSGLIAVASLVAFAYIVWIPLVLLVVGIAAGLISWRFR